MTKQQIISEAVDILEKLPQEKAEEIRNLLKQYLNKKDEDVFEAGFTKLVSDSASYDFLKNEPDIYGTDDLIERYR